MGIVFNNIFVFVIEFRNKKYNSSDYIIKEYRKSNVFETICFLTELEMNQLCRMNQQCKPYICFQLKLITIIYDLNVIKTNLGSLRP